MSLSAVAAAAFLCAANFSLPPNIVCSSQADTAAPQKIVERSNSVPAIIANNTQNESNDNIIIFFKKKETTNYNINIFNVSNDVKENSDDKKNDNKEVLQIKLSLFNVESTIVEPVVDKPLVPDDPFTASPLVTENAESGNSEPNDSKPLETQAINESIRSF
ncbi:MAG: hypothetical protein NkDv07_0941 [Candidatus Improbicoccus devescovinae]|nr:MAG: hypothetical protein NkDv07_0941 [Candidatus Improbicoccus devescovinae]